MKIIITQWALDSYLDLKAQRVFSATDYQELIRPDILLLKSFPSRPKFENGKFWSIASVLGKTIVGGYKMKWHQVGHGKVQMRLLIAIFNKTALLCEGYVKTNANMDTRKLLIFKTHVQLIQQNRYTVCGELT